MNPYFQNQQFGYQNIGGYYGYNQGVYQGYGYANPTQSIQAMYTTVHPYDSKQFLLSTFGNKPQYIQFFLTLSHQDKLKMYMLMEQKKLYGEISDKQSYQRILKLIAQKIQNFNLFHQRDSQKQISQDKSKQLENKIDLIVQKTFQKLNLPKTPPKTSAAQREELVLDQDQWVQSTETNEPEQLVLHNPSVMPESALIKKSSQDTTKKQEPKNQVFNMFTFDSKMYEAMTHQIGLKTASELQKKSIWQLQVEESQIRDQEPNLKEIFKVKSSTQQKTEVNNYTNIFTTKSQNQNMILSSMSSPRQARQQFNPVPMNSDEIYNLYKINESASETLPKQQEQEENEDEMQEFNSFVVSHPQQVQDNHSNIPVSFQTILPSQHSNFFKEKAHLIQGQQQLQISQKKFQQNTAQIQEQTNQDEEKEKKIIQQSQFNSGRQIASLQKVEKELDYEHLLFDSVQVQTPAVSSDFDFLQPYTSTRKKSQSTLQPIKLPQEFLTQNKPFEAQILAQSQLMSQTIAKVQQKPEPIVEPILESAPLDLIRSSLGSHNWQNQEMLKKLKVEFSQPDKSIILKGLKNKSFQCNIDFYLIIINFLRQASLEWSPQYRHFTDQCKIAKQLRQQSQRYSEAVNQDEQQKVTASIKKTKGLLNTIYQNSTKTEKYVQSLLDQKSDQRGLLYKFGRILLSSSLNTEIFQKVVNQDNKQIIKSFYMLYIIQKLSSIVKLKLFAQKLMIYLTQQYEKYKLLEEQKLNQVQNLEQTNLKYNIYIKGLVKICCICERIINLLKLCCLKTQSNTVKMLKICKDIRVKYSKYDEKDNKSANPLQNLQQTLKTDIQRNKSVYDLHNDFFQCYNREPICAVCLRQIKKEGNKIDQIYYHYSCFNLSLHIQRQIEYFTQ